MNTNKRFDGLFDTVAHTDYFWTNKYGLKLMVTCEGASKNGKDIYMGEPSELLIGPTPMYGQSEAPYIFDT